MARLLSLLIAVLLLAPRFVLAAEPAASTAVTAKPLPRAELMKVMEAYTVDLPPSARAAVVETIDAKLKQLKDAPPQATSTLEGVREAAADANAPVPLMGVMMTLDDDAEPAELNKRFAGCDDPLLRLALDLGAIKSGDRAAADRLIALMRSPKPTKHQKRLLKSYSLAIGINLAKDTSQDVFDFIQSATNHDKPKIPVGDKAPLFEAKAVDGETIRLADLHGKTVLLHFWSTWCGPCVGRMPDLKKDLARISKGSPSGDLVVVSVSLDFDRAAYDKALGELQPPGSNVYDGRGWGGDLARLYGVNRLPYDFVIDGSGVLRSNRVEEIEKVLADAVLGEHDGGSAADESPVESPAQP